MEWIEQYIGTIISTLAFIATVVAYIVKIIKTNKEEDIKTVVMDAMMYVEKNLDSTDTKLSSETKLILAKTLIMLECRNRGVKYDDDKYEGMIETLIDFSKHINYNKEEKDDYVDD